MIHQVFLWRWPKMQEPMGKKEQGPFWDFRSNFDKLSDRGKKLFSCRKIIVRWQQTVVPLNSTWWPVCCTPFMSYRPESSPVSIHSGLHPARAMVWPPSCAYFFCSSFKVWRHVFHYFGGHPGSPPGANKSYERLSFRMYTFASLIVLWFIECPTPPSEFILDLLRICEP